MFGKKKQKLRRAYNELLLQDIDNAKLGWDHARQTKAAVYDVDEELIAEVALAKARYEFLYREAKLRKVKGHIQASVLDY
ncbi:YaaL family protein [Ligilactobacillus apodemi]|nr:YaaL family protein [Ligilactobacillus apodemi]MBD5069460.1 YaaL family protein [Lactobacillus sp.]MCR1900330.1 YaaL family protein [Ligilactobacillus apodemi]